MDVAASFQMRFECRRGPAGFELLEQIGGGNNRLAQLADQLHRSGVDERNRRELVERGVLHGNGGEVLKQYAELGVHLLPPGIGEGAGPGSGSSCPLSMR